ncbi:unnamed protein product [Cuscuta epithymum]|uniref:Uncharacterized protein n=1 Tax=Cuscuta epithymum TaxID=186058 RepID=A0AAV0FZ13_9ASTE|nr:unnamed protein product [Cuscuta epithymum]
MPEDTTGAAPATTLVSDETEQRTAVTTSSTLTTEEKSDHHQILIPPKPDPNPTRVLINKKFIVLILTILTFILSLPILFTLIYLLYTQQYDCEDLLRLPRLQYAIVIGLAVVFLVSNLVPYIFASRFPIPAIVIVTVPLIVMLVVGLGLVGAYQAEARKIPGSPPWLKSKMHDDNAWPAIKTCIYETRTCKDLIARSYLLKSFNFLATDKLSSTEAGCCRPPLVCDMELVNVTYWRRPLKKKEDENGGEYNNKDCNLWDNKESILCYNCNTCKEGFVKSLEGKWRRLGAFLIAISLLLIVSHLLLFVATMWERYGG